MSPVLTSEAYTLAAWSVIPQTGLPVWGNTRRRSSGSSPDALDAFLFPISSRAGNTRSVDMDRSHDVGSSEDASATLFGTGVSRSRESKGINAGYFSNEMFERPVVLEKELPVLTFVPAMRRLIRFISARNSINPQFRIAQLGKKGQLRYLLDRKCHLHLRAQAVSRDIQRRSKIVLCARA